MHLPKVQGLGTRHHLVQLLQLVVLVVAQLSQIHLGTVGADPSPVAGKPRGEVLVALLTPSNQQSSCRARVGQLANAGARRPSLRTLVPSKAAYRRSPRSSHGSRTTSMRSPVWGLPRAMWQRGGLFNANMSSCELGLHVHQGQNLHDMCGKSHGLSINAESPTFPSNCLYRYCWPACVSSVMLI